MAEYHPFKVGVQGSSPCWPTNFQQMLKGMNKMKKLFPLFIILLIFGCTHFEVYNEIHPTIKIIGEEVGVIYKLGNLTISDTWDDIDEDKIEYLKKNKDDLKITLYIRYDNEMNSNIYFTYYVDGFEFEKNMNVISPDMLIANMNTIPNFYLYKINGDKVMEENEEKIEKQIQKVKEKVIEEKQDSKWKDDNKY